MSAEGDGGSANWCHAALASVAPDSLEAEFIDFAVRSADVQRVGELIAHARGMNNAETVLAATYLLGLGLCDLEPGPLLDGAVAGSSAMLHACLDHCRAFCAEKAAAAAQHRQAH